MSVDDVQLDVLVSGEEPDRRRRAAAVVVVVVVALVLAVGWFVDHRSRQGEFAAISGCAQRAASQYDESAARVVGMSEYVRPSLSFASDRTRKALYGMVAHEAASIGGGLQQARDACAAVDVRGWHSAQATALSAQVALLDGQLELLRETAADGQAYFADSNGVSDLKKAAAATLTAARPALVP